MKIKVSDNDLDIVHSALKSHLGHARPVTRADLVIETGFDDRKIRQCIIVSSSDSAGYFICYDETDMEYAQGFDAECESRIIEINEGRKTVKEFMRNFSQPELELVV